MSNGEILNEMSGGLFQGKNSDGEVVLGGMLYYTGTLREKRGKSSTKTIGVEGPNATLIMAVSPGADCDTPDYPVVIPSGSVSWIPPSPRVIRLFADDK